MITIRDDKSYLSDIDSLSIEKGIAELGIHSLRFSVKLTEEQIQENRSMFEVLSKEGWSKQCEQSKKEDGAKIEKIIDILNEKFMIYQYKNKEISYSKDNWDLFFWCNCGDMSYVTLNPNEKRSNEQQTKDINNVLDLLKTMEIDGVDVAIQYKIIYNKEKVTEIKETIFKKIENTFINYMGYTGKIKEMGKSYTGEIVYGFFKKGSRKNYYQVSNEWFLQNTFNN